MAYYNGKATCFTPSITLEGRMATLQAYEANDMPSGDKTVYPPQGVDGFSSVKVMGAYFSATDDVYTRVFRVRKGYGTNYDKCPHLEKVIFERGDNLITIEGFNDNPALKEIEFVDGCCISWDMAAFIDSPIETIRFGALIDSFINIWGGQAQYFTNVTNVEVCDNWDMDLAFYCSPLTIESLRNIIMNLGTVTNGQTLWLGEENLAKLAMESSSYIEEAMAKGWSLM